MIVEVAYDFNAVEAQEVAVNDPVSEKWNVFLSQLQKKPPHVAKCARKKLEMTNKF